MSLSNMIAALPEAERREAEKWIKRNQYSVDRDSRKSIAAVLRSQEVKREKTAADELLIDLFEQYHIKYLFRKVWDDVYVSDFFIPKTKTVIEVNSSSNATQRRDYFERVRGFRVVKLNLAV